MYGRKIVGFSWNLVTQLAQKVVEQASVSWKPTINCHHLLTRNLHLKFSYSQTDFGEIRYISSRNAVQHLWASWKAAYWKLHFTGEHRPKRISVHIYHSCPIWLKIGHMILLDICGVSWKARGRPCFVMGVKKKHIYARMSRNIITFWK